MKKTIVAFLALLGLLIAVSERVCQEFAVVPFRGFRTSGRRDTGNRLLPPMQLVWAAALFRAFCFSFCGRDGKRSRAGEPL